MDGADRIKSEAAAQGDQAGRFFDKQTGPFFRLVDWGVCAVSFFLVFGIYLYTLAPTVTLEDSGELAVASDYLGVPHPPGYPIWTLITWLFQWFFRFVRYNGHPNPAWSVGLASAFFGALSCALLGLLVSRSGADILRGMERETRLLGHGNETILCAAAGLSGALLFALSPVLWSQSVIVEVYSLNAFFLMVILLLAYRWMCRPAEDRMLYALAFMLGLGLTNHHSLLFILLGIATAIWLRDRPLFRDFTALGCVVLAALIFWQSFQPVTGPPGSESHAALRVAGVVLLLVPGALFFFDRRLMSEWKRTFGVLLLVLLGLSFYAYMPIASEQNPPMNWGYARTWQGFLHAVSRGQYERISPLENMKHALANPLHFPRMLYVILLNPREYISVVSQFTWPLALLALLPFAIMKRIARPACEWLWVTCIAFFSLTVIFLIFQYPQLDVQTLFIGRVQYIQAHAVFALWISYGLLFLLVGVDVLLKGKSRTTWAAAGLACLLPLTLVWRNAFNERFIKFVGGCEQRGHHFGWQFGNWSLQGVDGIRSDLQYWLDEDEFKAVWASYPDPAYPPPMGTNAVFFGGTDPGRFVPTYMIFSAQVREDVYLITQNALADNTYMSVMRDLYGDRIWIPSQEDSNFAFQQYVRDVQEGRVEAGADVVIRDGRVSVQGVQGVMQINGILARMIFDANKRLHPFYVEESYVIPWMYPYLEPHGLIMRINPEPLDNLSVQVVERDRAFWDWYCEWLLKQRRFLRDTVARKSFSKLRSAIAGLYAARRMYAESEYAFQQAVDLYPLSPEASFRLADVYMQQGKFGEARRVIEVFSDKDPANERAAGFLEHIRLTKARHARRRELEVRVGEGHAALQEVFELARLYKILGMREPFEGLTRNLMADEQLPADVTLEVARLFAETGNLDLLEQALRRYLERMPRNAQVWLDLIALYAATGRPRDAIEALRHGLEVVGEPVRDLARTDQRLDPLRDLDSFSQLVPPARRQPFSLPLPGM